MVRLLLSQQLLAVAVVVCAVVLVLVVDTCEGGIPRACSTPSTDKFPFCNPALPLDTRIKDLISRINLNEKPILLTARGSPAGNISRIGLPAYDWGANCVHGVQSKCGTRCPTSFTPPCALGASWNMTNVLVMGQIIGLELRSLWLQGADEASGHAGGIGLDCWSPNININRDPRWGRNQEVSTEDPYLGGLYAIAYTQGIQNSTLDTRYYQGISTLKHYAAYSLDDYPPTGVSRYNFNAIVDDYDLAMTYFPAFEAAIVQGGAQGVMCSYNSMNGVPTCASEFLETVLRQEWGFDGYVTTDTDSIYCIWHDHKYVATPTEAAAVALDANTDLNSGNSYLGSLLPALNQGLITEAQIDQALYRTLRQRFILGLFDPIDNQPFWHVPPDVVNTPESQAANLFATRQSMVLLQNKGNLLPLSAGKNIALIGPHGMSQGALLANYIGEICPDGSFSCIQTPFAAITKSNGNGKVVYAQGCTVSGTSKSGFAQAVTAAQQSDYVIMMLGLDQGVEAEMRDRQTIGLPGVQYELTQAVVGVGKPVVLVLINGGTVSIDWEKGNVPAILEAFYPGFQGAQAIADTIFGVNNPGGKLPVTVYQLNYTNEINYTSMSMTQAPGRGYRYYTGQPLWPFGWGLSYTQFNLSWSANAPETHHSLVDKLVIAQESAIEYVVNVTNTGNRAGDEVVQAYWKPTEVDRLRKSLGLEGVGLKKSLFGFERVNLQVGQTKQVRFIFNPSTVRTANVKGKLVIVPGDYIIEISNGVDQVLQRNVLVV